MCLILILVADGPDEEELMDPSATGPRNYFFIFLINSQLQSFLTDSTLSIGPKVCEKVCRGLGIEKSHSFFFFSEG